MKIQCDFTKFKAALKRNANSANDLFFRGEMMSCARVWYLQTKKAFIVFNPSNSLQSYQIWKLAINLKYIITKYEDLFNV